MTLHLPLLLLAVLSACGDPVDACPGYSIWDGWAHPWEVHLLKLNKDLHPVFPDGRCYAECTYTFSAETSQGTYSAEYTYDSEGRVVTGAGRGHDAYYDAVYEYTDEGLLSAETYSDENWIGGFTYAYDDNGILSLREYWANGETSSTYEILSYDLDDDRITTLQAQDTYSNGTTYIRQIDIEYDADQQLTNTTRFNPEEGDSPGTEMTYTWQEGAITTITETGSGYTHANTLGYQDGRLASGIWTSTVSPDEEMVLFQASYDETGRVSDIIYPGYEEESFVEYDCP